MKTRIDTLENQILARHQRIGTVVTDIGQKVRAKAVSPGALLAAVGLGVVVEQGRRSRGSSLANTLNAVNVYSAALVALSSWFISNRDNPS